MVRNPSTQATASLDTIDRRSSVIGIISFNASRRISVNSSSFGGSLMRPNSLLRLPRVAFTAGSRCRALLMHIIIRLCLSSSEHVRNSESPCAIRAACVSQRMILRPLFVPLVLLPTANTLSRMRFAGFDKFMNLSLDMSPLTCCRHPFSPV